MTSRHTWLRKSPFFSSSTDQNLRRKEEKDSLKRNQSKRKLKSKNSKPVSLRGSTWK
jgi:hypothetical protein